MSEEELADSYATDQDTDYQPGSEGSGSDHTKGTKGNKCWRIIIEHVTPKKARKSRINAKERSRAKSKMLKVKGEEYPTKKKENS